MQPACHARSYPSASKESYRQMAGFLEESAKTANSAKASGYGYEGAKLLGILMYLENKQSNIDFTVISAALNTYGDDILYSRIYERERVKRYDLVPPNPNKFDHHDRNIFFMYDSLAQEILIRTGRLAADVPKLRIQQLLELAKDDLNPKEYQTLISILDKAIFYRDEVLENRSFNANQLATCLRDLLKDTSSQKRKSIISKIEKWIQTDHDLKTLESELIK